MWQWQSASSQNQFSQSVNQNIEMKSKNVFQFSKYNIKLDSVFDGGNLAGAKINKYGEDLQMQVWGLPDVYEKQHAKYWIYFRLIAICTQQNLKIIVRKINSLKKFAKQTKYRPSLVYCREGTPWSLVNQATIDIKNNNEVDLLASIVLNNKTQQSSQMIYYFALNYPYTLDHLTKFIQQKQNKTNQSIHFCNKIVSLSSDGYPIHLLKITDKKNSTQNIQEQEIQKKCQKNDFQKNACNYIIITARVHPSEVQSSFFIQSLINDLFDNSLESQLLLNKFIFYIFPMLNVDGVQQGTYRLDTQNRNLNRYYGHSNHKTQPIQAVEQLLEKISNQVIAYFDIHGHCSPKKSFIYGNFTQNNKQLTEKKLLCKLISKRFADFDHSECQFSKRNMNVKQRYDNYSKMSSGRAYIGRVQQKQQLTIFHSYTVEIAPYLQIQQMKIPIKNKIKDQYKSIEAFQNHMNAFSKALLNSILEIVGLHPSTRFEQLSNLRRNIYREVIEGNKSGQKSLQKIKNKIEGNQILKYYNHRLFPTYTNIQQFLNSNLMNKNMAIFQYLCKTDKTVEKMIAIKLLEKQKNTCIKKKQSLKKINLFIKYKPENNSSIQKRNSDEIVTNGTQKYTKIKFSQRNSDNFEKLLYNDSQKSCNLKVLEPKKQQKIKSGNIQSQSNGKRYISEVSEILNRLETIDDICPSHIRKIEQIKTINDEKQQRHSINGIKSLMKKIQCQKSKESINLRNSQSTKKYLELLAIQLNNNNKKNLNSYPQGCLKSPNVLSEHNISLQWIDTPQNIIENNRQKRIKKLMTLPENKVYKKKQCLNLKKLKGQQIFDYKAVIKHIQTNKRYTMNSRQISEVKIKSQSNSKKVDLPIIQEKKHYVKN